MLSKKTSHLILLCAISNACSSSAEPSASSGFPDDVAKLGHADSVLFWTHEEKLAGFRNYDRLFPTRSVVTDSSVLDLPIRPVDFGRLAYAVNGDTFDIHGFKEHNRVAGLLAIKNGTIVLEEYGFGNTHDTKWVSYSIAKSVVSMLIGAAIQDGYIGRVDDSVTDYVPLLRGSAYEDVTIRNLLQMSSGVAWNEDYTDPSSDLSQEIGMPSLARLEALGRHPRVTDPGARFNYNTGETHLVGSVLRSAIGNNLSTYLTEKIWQPFGMESDAYWRLIDAGGAEHGGCCISATLRDYGRVGLFALGGGVLADGTKVVPDGWLEQSTTPATTNDGYGYLWWLGGADSYSAIGIFGQAISVQPSENLVIVTHGLWPQATGVEFSAHRSAFFAALTTMLRD